MRVGGCYFAPAGQDIGRLAIHMRTGFSESFQEWRWGGRRYFGGLIFGLWLGILLGILISRELPIPDRSGWFFPLLWIATCIVGLISRWITGAPSKVEADRQRQDG